MIVKGKIMGAIEVELDFDKIEEMIYSASFKAVYSIIITIVILGLILVLVLFSVVIRPMIAATDKAEHLGKRIIELFDNHLTILRDKNSSIQLSISIAVATADPMSCHDTHCLFERIAELKKKVKRLNGSNFLIE